MKLKSVDLTVSLESLSFYLAQRRTTYGAKCASARCEGLPAHVERQVRGRRREMVDVGDKP